MCFNTESSITVFIGIICSIALFHRSIKNNSKIDFFSSILLILITSMQLIEYVLWQNQVCNDRIELRRISLLYCCFYNL